MADSQRNWSGLPKDLLIRIHNSLSGGSINRQLLRAVCPAWRVALPLAGDESRRPPPSPLLRIPLFFDFSCDPWGESPDLPPHDMIQLKRNLLVSSHEPDQKWIIQIQQTEPGKLSLFNPLTGRKLQFPPGMKLDQVNLLDFRITDLGASLRLMGIDVLSCNNGFLVSPLKKMIAPLCFAPDSFVLMALSEDEGLFFWQPGLEKWSRFRPNDEIGGFDRFSGSIKDIVTYRKMFYAVDGVGRLLMFDPSSWWEPVTVVSSPLVEGEEEDYHVYMYLVVSEGYLYLVVRIKEGLNCSRHIINESSFQATPSKVRVYVFKEEMGTESRWDEVKSIGDRVFFIGWDSTFSIPSSDHGWNVKNRVYFGGIMGESKDFDLEYGLGAGIYDLGSSHFVQFNCWADHGVHTRLFWPPPRWIAPDANLDSDMDPYEWLHEMRRVEREKTDELLKDFYDPRFVLDNMVINTSLIEALQSMGESDDEYD